MAQPLHVESVCLGDWMTNCYVLHRSPVRGESQRSKPCWIVDAGFDPGPLIEYVRQHKLDPVQVVLTHAHVDHIAGLDTIRAAWPTIPILIHETEREALRDPTMNLSIILEEPILAPEATGVLHHGDRLELDGLTIEVRHTPGHSPGGISLYQPHSKLVLSGDSLFNRSIGRFDLPGSDHTALLRGIREQLLTLPDDTRVYPGHGPPTTIGEERRENPYL